MQQRNNKGRHTQTVHAVESPRKPRWLAKIGLAVCSILVTYGLLLVGSRFYSWRAGIHDLHFRYENQIDMWRPDRATGFVNKRNFSDYCFGNVHVTTNEHGFRGQQSYAVTKAPGTTRIIGLGDSVMWGTSVDQAQSFLGFLSARLNSDSPQTEVINAGVVGYSTLQEYRLLESTLLDLSPDLVLINFCENDLLATEDPHGLVRDVYVDHIRQFVGDSGDTLSQPELHAIAELIHAFESPAPVHVSLGQTSIACRMMAMKLFLEIPIRRMAQITKDRNARLIYLLIPPRDDDDVYLQLAQMVKQILDEIHIAYLDLRPMLKGDRFNRGTAFPVPPPGQGLGDLQNGAGSGWLARLEQRLLPDVRALKVVRQMDKLHREHNYIDFIHPSRKGNEIIAQAIFDHLAGIPSAPASSIPASSIIER